MKYALHYLKDWPEVEFLTDFLFYICNTLHARNPEPSCDFDNSPDIVRLIQSRETGTVECITNCRKWAREQNSGLEA